MQHGILHSAAETMTTIAYSAPAGLVASILVKRIQKFKYIVITGWILLSVGMGSNVRFLYIMDSCGTWYLQRK
jgi:ascorbate-specific PTS system EIIC-type component UlaA